MKHFTLRQKLKGARYGENLKSILEAGQACFPKKLKTNNLAKCQNTKYFTICQNLKAENAMPKTEANLEAE